MTIGNSHLAEIFHLTLETRDRWDLGNLILTSQGTPLISGKVRDKISSSNSNGGNQQWWQMGRRCYTLPSEHSKSTSDSGKLDLAARGVGGELRSRPWQQELQGKTWACRTLCKLEIWVFPTIGSEKDFALNFPWQKKCRRTIVQFS